MFQPRLPRRPRAEKCKISIKRVNGRIEKSISGNCSKDQLRALSGLNEENTRGDE